LTKSNEVNDPFWRFFIAASVGRLVVNAAIKKNKGFEWYRVK
jgi:hypothetical protein